MSAVACTFRFCESPARWVVCNEAERIRTKACGKHLNGAVSALCGSPLTVTSVHDPAADAGARVAVAVPDTTPEGDTRGNG